MMISLTRYIAALVFTVFVVVEPASVGAQQTCSPPSLTAVSVPNIFSEEQEVFLGDAIAAHVQHNWHVIEAEEVNSYLQQIGSRIAEKLPPNRLRFQFMLVDLPDPNAFVLPGGRIYVSRKMVAASRTEDELAGVLGHEMGHLLARQQTILITRQLKEVLGITEVGDRADIFKKYNLLVENAARKPDLFRRAENREDKDQIQADQIGIFATAQAGYDPAANSQLFARLTQAKDEGGFLAKLFGVSAPETRRLGEMIKGTSALPKSCVRTLPADADTAFRNWQAAVLTYTGLAHKESLHSVISKINLEPPLRGEISRLKFSPDGKYVIAQDGAGIDVLSVNPFKELFRIPARDTDAAQFSPDSKTIVFSDSALRIEIWSIADAKLKEAHELLSGEDCLDTLLSSDGKFLACFDSKYSLKLIDVTTEKPVFERKSFFTPTYIDLVNRYFSTLVGRDDAWVHLEFSPDNRYLAAGKSGALQSAALILDIPTGMPLVLKDPIRKIISMNFLFTAPDRMIAVNNENPKKSVIFTLPKFEVIRELAMFPTHLTAATHGDYIQVRPVQDHPVGLMDLEKGGVFITNDTSALDSYDQMVVAERLTGELGLYEVGRSQPIAVLQRTSNELGTIRTGTASPDLEYIALSDSLNGGVWDLRSGKRLLQLRGFRDAQFSDKRVLAADFPANQKFTHQFAQIDLAVADGSVAHEVKEDGMRQFGAYIVKYISPPKMNAGNNTGSVTMEIQEARTLKTLWSRVFAKEVPSVSLNSRDETLVLGWSVSDKAVDSELLPTSPARAQLAGLKGKDGVFLLEVLGARDGKLKGQVLVDTGKGSFSISSALATNEHILVYDSEHRISVYSMTTAAKIGQIFGARSDINAAAGLIAVENESGHLAIYDLKSLEKLDEFLFDHPIAILRFSADGRRVFALTSNQVAYVLNVK